MLNKRFAERLNAALDNIGLPTATNDRIEALAKLLRLRNKTQVAFLLNGKITPDEDLLTHLAEELDVSADWLMGKPSSKFSPH